MGLGHLQKCYKLDGRVKRPLEGLELHARVWSMFEVGTVKFNMGIVHLSGTS